MRQTLPTALWLPAVVVMAATVAALVADTVDRRRASVWFVGVGLGSGALLCFALASQSGAPTAAGALASGAGFTTLPGVGYALAGCAVLAGLDRLATLERGAATAALIALGAVFSHALLAAADTKVLFAALVGVATIAYALIGGAGTRRAEEAAVRYFIQGAVVSGLTVYGLAVLFGLAGGASDYSAAVAAVGTGGARSALLALVLILSVFAFKLGAFPFHSWVPDAYETGNASDVGFLASTPKLAALVALLVVIRGALFSSSALSAVNGLLLVLALGSLLFGAFGMVRQRAVGRLLGYSAIAQAGYGLAALASGTGAASATVMFGLTYAVGVCAAFVALEALSHVDPDWDGSLAGLAGLSRRAPVVALCLALSMLSLTGIPLFAGFWGKYVVLVALADAGLIWPAVVAGLAAVVSFAGYGAVIRWAYFEAAPDSGTPSRERVWGTGLTEGGTEEHGEVTRGGVPAGPEGPEGVESRSEIEDGEAVQAERAGAAGAVAVALAVVIVLLGSIPLVTGFEPIASFFGLS